MKFVGTDSTGESNTHSHRKNNIIRSDKISRRHKNQINEMDNYSSRCRRRRCRTCMEAYHDVAAIQFVERQH